MLTALDGDGEGGSPAADKAADGGGEGHRDPLGWDRRGPRLDPEGDGEEHDEEAALVADRDASTAWTTMEYYDPLELQKSGVGLVLDLGAPADVPRSRSARRAGRPTSRCGWLGDPGRSPAAFQEFDGTTNATGPTTLRVAEPVRARYVLVWLTESAGGRRQLPREHQRGDRPGGRATRRPVRAA